MMAIKSPSGIRTDGIIAMKNARGRNIGIRGLRGVNTSRNSKADTRRIGRRILRDRRRRLEIILEKGCCPYSRLWIKIVCGSRNGIG